MGPLFVILGYLIVTAIFAVFWIASLLTFIIGRIKKVRWLTWLGGIPLISLTLIGVLVIGLIGYSFIRSQNPCYVYEDTFQEDPSTDVTEIQSNSWSFADEGHVYLRFRASDETFQRILPKQLERVSYKQYKRRMSDGLSYPDWWILPTETTSEIYYLHDSWFGGGKRFASETTLMTYDASTSTIEYYFMGID
ncbi:MAG: hypothetical protein ACYDGS_09745 [Thermoleophilia bacterium]